MGGGVLLGGWRRARVGCGGEGGALVVAEVVGGMCGGRCRVGWEENVVGREGKEGLRVGCVGEVVPVKVGGVVIAGQD